MICISLAEPTVTSCLKTLENIAFAEIRMDMVDLSVADVRAIFSCHANLIATCRPGRLPARERKKLLLAAIEAGAAFVDVEIESPSRHRHDIIAAARALGTSVIVSFHDYEKTPGKRALASIVSRCFRAGADIAKIACLARSPKESARLLGLLDDERPLVVVGMGEKGRVTRVAAPLLESAFTFASLTEGKETAPGQMDEQTLRTLLRSLGAQTDGEPGDVKGTHDAKRRRKAPGPIGESEAS